VRCFPHRVRSKFAKICAKIISKKFDASWPRVDVRKILEHYAQIIEFDNPDCDGFTAYDTRTNRYIVCINRKDIPEGRIRFTLAHELGHIFLGHLKCLEGEPPERVLRIWDREADIFATELLMPEEWLETMVFVTQMQLFGSKELAWLKKHLGVSWEALIIRLDELGIQPAEVSVAFLRGEQKVPSVRI